ncbi:be58ca52-ac8b-4225-b3c4-c3ec358facfd [Thermothielavioides terrestris]|uniref:Be58ca52-ac8b-4225-b3c4-c3ec358facfd n=1 Tax=Thermothielavioides terrestris TaxID=2587410 RepID=A0A446B747_9PEZI|nr:be58ca52-ac8b-4225-b3c4-c3ec358facfd [Thermothielavioides terrestris]
MSNDPAARRLLPQTSQMGSFSFAPSAYPQQPRETQKNYVFVDEHNRHKRLKVMRACEGCRRRKIKCDAATTNTWPCSACIRLKLHCVRPNGLDSGDSQVYEPSQPQFEAAQIPDSFRQQLPLQDQQLLAHAPKQGALYPPQTSYQDAAGLYHSVQYTESQPVPHELQYAPVPHQPVGVVDQHYTTQTSAFPTPPLQHAPQPDSPEDTFQSEYAQQDLADLLGSLKVDEAGTAPYLNSKMRHLREEEPAVEDGDEYKTLLPPLTTGPGLKIRIPPELMPDDDTVLHYLDLYFVNAHPYVPVLDKNYFYHQWHNNRESISPLLLEAIFAIAGRLADEPAQGQQWLALATRHADSFMDVPRLSTLQALMILLKARESAPKKGYYYRSWMSIVQCVQLAKDLGLDEHFADHQAGRSCNGSQAECALKTRIWQTLFVVELMIGSPQGRTDFQIEESSVDFSIPRPPPNGDDSEYLVSRNFAYLALAVRPVGRMARTYGRLKRSKDWGIDPEFVQLDPSLTPWLAGLPPDLTISYPADGSPPWLPSPFVGNLHSYYYLTIILYNRPQLAVLSPSAPGGQWKRHMLVSYNAAKILCRLQEAVMGQFGLKGLQCMQRGINFTIYVVLGCIVLHLVAITSPDPDLNAEARDYFTRHMRILEKCMSAWPMPDMQKQVDSVREAFSADTRKPFVLKPTFPYGSPHSATHPSPPGMPHSQVSYTTATATATTTNAHHHPLTPVSVGPPDSKSVSPVVPALTTMAPGAASQASSGVAQTLPLAEAPPAWNPSRIFDQWNISFGGPPILQPSPPTANAVTLQDIHQLPHPHHPHQHQHHQQAMQGQLRAAAAAHAQAQAQYAAAVAAATSAGASAGVPVQQQQQQPQQQQPQQHSFVTPAMWQESVASVYENGLKRGWDWDGGQTTAGRERD